MIPIKKGSPSESRKKDLSRSRKKEDIKDEPTNQQKLLKKSSNPLNNKN